MRQMAGVLTAVAALITLTACPPTCTYVAAPTGMPMVTAGGTFPVNVTTAANCSWTFQGNDPWITVGPDPDSTGPAGSGNGRVLVTAAANAGAARRTGTATIATQTITIDQAGTGGSGCTFQVSPPELTFTGGAAGTGQFTITASAAACGWRASRSSNLEDTVNLTSGGAGGGAEDRFGLGSATIVYQVKANSPTSPWPAGGGDIVVHDSAQQGAATHHVKLQ
jgi:hypothetical protein